MKNNSGAAAAPALHSSASELISELGYSATFFDQISNEIAIIDGHGNIWASNDKFKDTFGQAHKKNLLEFLSSSPDELILALEKSSSSSRVDTEVSYQEGSLTPRTFNINVYSLEQDRFALIHHENEYERLRFWRPRSPTKSSEKDFGFLESSKVGLLRADRSGRVIATNERAKELLGIRGDKFIVVKRLSDFGLENTPQTHTRAQIVRSDGTETSLTTSRMNITETECLITLDATELELDALEKYERGHEFYKVFAEESEYEIARFELKKPISINDPADEIVRVMVEEAYLTDHSLPHNEPTGNVEPNINFNTFIGNEGGSA